MTTQNQARWAVVNAVLSPEDGNGVWSWNRTRMGARRSKKMILQFNYHSGYYLVPSGGLIICRVRKGKVIR